VVTAGQSCLASSVSHVQPSTRDVATSDAVYCSPATIPPRSYAPSHTLQTIDFESTEEGYLASILKGEGSSDVPINEPIAIIAEVR
jgi:hypothetical protein